VFGMRRLPFAVALGPFGRAAMICDECGSTRSCAARRRDAGARRAGRAVPRRRVVDVDGGNRRRRRRADRDRDRIGVAPSRAAPPTSGMVAFLDLDQELLAPRYRAAAQAHWLTTRGASSWPGGRETRRGWWYRRASRTTSRPRPGRKGQPGLVAEAETGPPTLARVPAIRRGRRNLGRRRRADRGDRRATQARPRRCFGTNPRADRRRALVVPRVRRTRRAARTRPRGGPNRGACTRRGGSPRI